MLANTFELLYDTITRPRHAFTNITQRPFHREAVLAFVLLVALSSLAGISFIGGGAVALTAISLITGAIGLFFWAAVLHLTVTLLGGNGDVRGLLRALPFAQFPQTFASFFPILLLWFPSASITALIGVLSTVFSLWMVYLQLLAISINYRIDISRALLAFVIPGLVLVLFILALIGLMITSLFSAITADPSFLQQFSQDISGINL